MDGFWWDRFWGLMTGVVPLFLCFLCIPKLQKLKNLDIEVWALRGIVAIFIVFLMSTQVANFPFLSRFVGNVVVWLFVAVATTSVIDFQSPKRCKPKRKITNVSAILPPPPPEPDEKDQS